MHRHPITGDVVTIDHGMPVVVIDDRWQGDDCGSIATFITTAIDCVEHTQSNPPTHKWEIVTGTVESAGHTPITLSRVQLLSTMKLNNRTRNRLLGTIK